MPGWGRTLKLAATVGLGVGLAHCSIDLGYLTKDDNSGNGDSLSEPPPWARGGPIAGKQGDAGAAGADAGPGTGTQEDPGGGGSGGQVGFNPEEVVDAYKAFPAELPDWCAQRKGDSLCADFENDWPLSQQFYPVEGTPPPSYTNGASRSGTNSLLVKADASSRQGPFSVKVGRSFIQPSVNGFTLEFQFRPETVSSSPALITAVDFGTPTDGSFYSIRLALESQLLHLEQHSGGVDTRLASVPVTIKGWSHLRLSVDLAGSAPVARFATIDDNTKVLTPVDGRSSIPLSLPARLGAGQALLVGVVYGTQPHEGWSLNFDNIAFKLR
jgi:hypothetical protein